jgi:hypothetical protein
MLAWGESQAVRAAMSARHLFESTAVASPRKGLEIADGLRLTQLEPGAKSQRPAIFS